MNTKAVISLLLLLFYPASLRPAEEDTPRTIEIQRLKEEIYALHLIHLLNLTQHQVDFILKRSELAAPIIVEHERLKLELMREQRSIYAHYLEESRADKGFSPEVEHQTRLAYGQDKLLQNRLAEQLNVIAKPILEILTDAQVETLSNYKPILFPGKIRHDLATAADDWRTEALKEILQEAAALSDAQYRKRRDKLVTRMLNTVPPNLFYYTKRVAKGTQKNPRESETRDEVKVRLGQALDEWRGLPGEDRASAEERFILKRIVPSKSRQLENQMKDVRRTKRPTADNAARFLLNQDAAPYLRSIKKRLPKGKPVKAQ
jgi:hypothetical protein